MAIEATVFDRNWRALADISPEWQNVAWRLNGVGMARFGMPYSDAKCRRDFLREGNGLYVRFSTDIGLPAWGGVIDLPENQDDGGVTISGYSGEHILTWRETSKNLVLSGPPGTIFRGLLDEANGVLPMGIMPGVIYTGGGAIDREYHFHELFRQSQELASDAQEDFHIAPNVTGGVLSFTANWYERRGHDWRDKVYLVGGRNVERAQLVRQGNLANHIEIAGSGADWSSARYVGIGNDVAARSLSGYREWKEVNVGIVTAATIEAHVAAKLKEMAYPQRVFELNVLNTDPAGFADYDVGDLVSCQLFLNAPAEWRYEGDVRVLVREWTPGGVSLAVEEWIE